MSLCGRQPTSHRCVPSTVKCSSNGRPTARACVDGGEEHRRDIAAHQPLAVLAERAMRPDRRVKVQAA
jgi:hypothetical protein